MTVGPAAAPLEINRDDLSRVVLLYADVKRLILRAEQLDKKMASSVAVAKEERDALDHLIRVFADLLSSNPRGPSYQIDNFDKAVGHLCRAAYDACDTLAITFKLRVIEALKDRSNDAITVAFPDYYPKHRLELSQIDRRVEESRAAKDIGEFTISKLQNYMQFMECDTSGAAVGAGHWDRPEGAHLERVESGDRRDYCSVLTNESASAIEAFISVISLPISFSMLTASPLSEATAAALRLCLM